MIQTDVPKQPGESQPTTRGRELQDPAHRDLLSLASAWLPPVSELLERYAAWAAGVILLATFVVALGQSAHKPFSYDEYITYKVSSLPHLRDVWNFYAEGLDTTGPLPALIAHATSRIPASPEISARIPFALAFLGVSFGLFGFLRRRYPAGFALAAMLVLLEMPSVAYHLTDARSYAILLGGAAMAAFCWQLTSERNTRPWSVLALWFFLAIAMSAHFFAIFLIVPFALAQAVNDFSRKRIDIPVWLAILLFPLGWLPFLPGQLHARAYYAAHFWSKAQPDNIMDAYEFCITNSSMLIVVLCVFFLGLALSMSRKEQPLERSTKSGLTTAEWVLAFVLLLLPIYAWLGSLLLGAYQIKYVLPFSIGLLICLIAALAELARRNAATGVVFLAVILIFTLSDDKAVQLCDGLLTLFDANSVHQQIRGQILNQQWIKELATNSLPIATDNDTYRLLDFYGTPALSARVYGLTNFAEAAKYENAITDQTNLMLFSRRLPLRTMDIEDFLKQHPHFLVVAHRTRHHFEWLPEYFLDRQRTKRDLSITLRSLDNDESKVIYEVQMLPTATP